MTLRARLNLLDWQARFTGPGPAVAEARSVAEAVFKVLGSDSPEGVLARSYLARYLAHSGQVAEALRLLRRVWSDQNRMLGETHGDSRKTLQQIEQLTRALDLLSQGGLDKAMTAAGLVTPFEPQDYVCVWTSAESWEESFAILSVAASHLLTIGGRRSLHEADIETNSRERHLAIMDLLDAGRSVQQISWYVLYPSYAQKEADSAEGDLRISMLIRRAAGLEE